MMKPLPGPDDIVIHDLPNGIKLLIRENPYCESVTCLGYLQAGAISDPDDLLGLADFTAAALMTGTARHDLQSLFNLIESIGASMHFSSGTNITDFSAQCLKEDLPVIFDLLSDILQHPTFPQKQFNRLKAQSLTGLAIRAQDTAEMAALEFDKMLYHGHPYARPEEGYVETVQKITIPDLARFHRQYYGPKDMVMVVVGAASPGFVIESIRESLGSWHNPDQVLPLPIPTLTAQLKSCRSHVEIPEKSQSDIVMGSRGPSRDSQHYLPCLLGNNILGQFGMMGRIGDVVREKEGLAYYAQSNLNAGHGPGAWEFVAGVNPENMEKAISLIKKEIKRYIQKGVTKEELEDTKSFFISRQPLSLESNLGVAISLINMQRFDLGFDYLQRYAGNVSAVTGDMIMEASRHYLSAENLVVASAGKPVL